MKTISVDFDGVLHSYESGWKGIDQIPDPPVPGALEFLQAATSQFKVAIYSARSCEEAGRTAMVNWLDRHLQERFGVRDGCLVMGRLQFPYTKPPAAVILDDRALTFTGVFPSMDELDAFTPWNK